MKNNANSVAEDIGLDVIEGDLLLNLYDYPRVRSAFDSVQGMDAKDCLAEALNGLEKAIVANFVDRLGELGYSVVKKIGRGK